MSSSTCTRMTCKSLDDWKQTAARVPALYSTGSLTCVCVCVIERGLENIVRRVREVVLA